jgi:selenocysteine lyase/cysteine desulfurase
MPRPVFEHYQAWRRERETQPVEFLGRLRELLAEARTSLADYLRTNSNDLVYVPNITFAINIVARSLDLAAWTRDWVTELTGMEPICSGKWFGQMCVLPLPRGTLDRLGTQLWDEYRIEIPQVRWEGREFLRLSIQAYNSVDDVQHLLAALEELL